MEKQPLPSWSRLLRRERELRGWSQERVANALNISPKSIGRWERGEAHPSLEYSALLCELYKRTPEELELVRSETLEVEANGHSTESENHTDDLLPFTGLKPAKSFHVDWGEALHVRQLYGRERERHQLKEWLGSRHCSVIAILGTGGIGKTALASAITEQVQDTFDYVFWRSLQNAPTLDTLLQKCMLFLSTNAQIELPIDVEDKITLFIDYLRQYRCLLILDNLETILKAGEESGNWLPGYEGYGRLLKRLGEVQHDSCLLLTSREKPKEIAHAEGQLGPVRALRLSGLELGEAQKMLEDNNLTGTADSWKAFIYLYSGNPLALKLVAGTIREIFRGDITRFLKEGMALFGDVYDLMDQQFHRLSTAEQEVLYWLAIEREPVSLESLRENILRPHSRGSLLKALESLQRRCMIEMDSKGLFGLQPAIMEYVNEALIESIYHEISGETPRLLIKHALIKAQARDYIRDSQFLLIMTPLALRLLDTYSKEELAEKCRKLLNQLRQNQGLRPGYAAGNLLNLLTHLEFDMRGFDFSALQIRQAYLQNRSLAGLNLTGADIVTSTFTDTFGSVLSIAFSPDGTLVAAGTASCDIRIWQVSTGTPLFTLKGHDHWVSSVAFSPNGRLLASGSIDQSVRIWDMQTRRCQESFLGHTNRVRVVAFSPDGRLLASGSNDETIRVWDLKTSQCQHILHGHKGWIWSVAFSPDGHLLASGSSDQTIRFWDLRSGQSTRTLEGHTDWIMAIAFSPDGRLLISGGDDQYVRIWDVVSGRCLDALSGHLARIRSVAFASNGYTIASSSDDHFIRLWDVRTGRCLSTLHAHTNRVRSVAFSPDALLLASGGEDQTVRLWEIATEHCLNTFQGYINGVTSTVFSADNTIVASGSEDRTIRLWNLNTGACLKTLVGHTGWVWSVAFHPDPSYQLLASGSHDQTVRIWDVAANTCLKVLDGHTDWVWSVAFSPGGHLLASGSEDQTIRLWDVETGECINTLEGHTNSVGAVIFSPDGSLLASSGGDTTVRLWDVKSGKCLHTLNEFIGRAWSVALSAGQNILVGVGSDQEVHLWEVNSGRYVNTLEGHTNWIRFVAFNAEGTLLASSAYDQTIRVWDVQSGSCLHILEGHRDWVRSVAFSPDGDYLISGSKDGTVKYWDVRSGKCLKTLRNERLYEGMGIGGITGLTDAQKAALKTLGAREDRGGA